jgi:phage shock protein C
MTEPWRTEPWRTDPSETEAPAGGPSDMASPGGGPPTDGPPTTGQPRGEPPTAWQPTGPAPPAGPRRLRRSTRDRVVGGVCGGAARYLDVDPVLLRVAAVALALSGGLGVLAYLVAWIVIPEAGEDEPERAAPPAGGNAVAVAVGAALVGLGALLLLLRQWLPGLGTHLFWPLVVVAVGILVLVSARR